MLSKQQSIFVILLITIISIMGVSTILPALPEIKVALNLTPVQLGLILTVFTLPGVFLAPLAGIIVDRYGRKTVLIPSLLIFGFAGVACAFAPTYHILLFLRILQGIGLSALNLLTNILITDMYTGKERVKMLGYNAMVLGFGTGFMPLIGGILAELDWRFPFLAASIALPVAFASLFIQYTPVKKITSPKEYFHNAKHAIASLRVAFLFLLALGTFLIVYGPIATYYPLFASTCFTLSPLWIGVSYASFAFTTAFATLLLPALLRLFSLLALIRIAHITYIISMLSFLLIQNPYFLPIPLMLYGFAQGLKYPNLVTLVSEEASDNNRGIMLSLQGMIFRLAQTLAPLLFATAYTAYSFHGVYILGAIVACIMLFISTFALHNKKEIAS